MTQARELSEVKKRLKKVEAANMELIDVEKENAALRASNFKLKADLEEAKKQAAKYENLFLQVSSHCACMKKNTQ